MVRVEEIPLFFHQFGIHTDIGDDSQAAEDISLKKGSSFFHLALHKNTFNHLIFTLIMVMIARQLMMLAVGYVWRGISI